MRCGVRILKLSLVNALLIKQVFRISIIQSAAATTAATLPPQLVVSLRFRVKSRSNWLYSNSWLRTRARICVKRLPPLACFRYAYVTNCTPTTLPKYNYVFVFRRKPIEIDIRKHIIWPFSFVYVRYDRFGRVKIFAIITNGLWRYFRNA